ncbi:hypothetical protein DJ90_4822 [Paenibacillus macerans]|uniref:Uncharacterized protein n=1 Tax=Paenibacillus macerans TaxID=44252 RepID=A0A090Y4S8_PAEMA|nr:hypothetical protein DJ90_4822 [Paenibacillus macerans]
MFESVQEIMDELGSNSFRMNELFSCNSHFCVGPTEQFTTVHFALFHQFGNFRIVNTGCFCDIP